MVRFCCQGKLDSELKGQSMNVEMQTKHEYKEEIKRAILVLHDFEKWAFANGVEMVTPYQKYDKLFDAWIDASLGLGALWHVLEWHETNSKLGEN